MVIDLVKSFDQYVCNYWQSLTNPEIRGKITYVTENPYLPFVVTFFCLIMINLIIPKIIKLRGKPFDSRPIQIIFHGTYFGILGSSILLFLSVSKGLMLYAVCGPIKIPSTIESIRYHLAIILVVFEKIYLLHFFIISISGKRVNHNHLFYALILLFYTCFMINYHPHENNTFFVPFEIFVLTIFSALQVMNATSSEIQADQLKLRRNVYRFYLGLRVTFFTTVILYSIFQLIFECTMEKKIALIQLIINILGLLLFLNEIKRKTEYPVVDEIISSESVDKKCN